MYVNRSEIATHSTAQSGMEVGVTVHAGHKTTGRLESARTRKHFGGIPVRCLIVMLPYPQLVSDKRHSCSSDTDRTERWQACKPSPEPSMHTARQANTLCDAARGRWRHAARSKDRMWVRVGSKEDWIIKSMSSWTMLFKCFDCTLRHVFAFNPIICCQNHHGKDQTQSLRIPLSQSTRLSSRPHDPWCWHVCWAQYSQSQWPSRTHRRGHRLLPNHSQLSAVPPEVQNLE